MVFLASVWHRDCSFLRLMNGSRTLKFSPKFLVIFGLVFLLARPQPSQSQVDPPSSTTEQTVTTEYDFSVASRAVKEISSQFVDRPQLMAAFLDALIDGGNVDKVKALANQLENSEETFIKLAELISEKLPEHPGVDRILKESSDVVHERLRTDQVVTPSVGMRLFEFALFSGTYLGLIYSLNGFDPMLADLSFRSAFQDNLGMYTLLMVILMRQGIGLRAAISQYFKGLRQRARSKQFLQSFQKWIQTVPSKDQLEAIQEIPNIHKNAVESGKPLGLTADTFDKSIEELQKLRDMGLLKQLKNYFRKRGLQQQITHFASYLSPTQRQDLQTRYPEDKWILNTEEKYKSIFIYNKIKLEISRWMQQQKVEELSNLRTEVQERIDNNTQDLAARTRLSTFEHINIQFLTMGTIAIGTGLSIASGAASFDWIFSENFLSTLRSEDSKTLFGVATLILPAFSLALHEASWISSLRNHRRRYSRTAQAVKKENKRLREFLDILTIIELDPNLDLSKTEISNDQPYSANSVITQSLDILELPKDYSSECAQVTSQSKEP